MKLDKTKAMFWFGHLGFVGFTAMLLLWLSPAMAAEPAVAASTLPEGAISWGFLAAAVATGLSALGAGIAVSNVGSAAIGAMAEKPEILGRTLIVIGLAEGIAIYGLIVSILILNQII
ncbi:MAG: H+transporting two-sector ATPase C subunit [Gammaproteobacteria bacterium]|nr:H+transporting two-sector ATPase C subunit [Gammaproteobacteria bacterium]